MKNKLFGEIKSQKGRFWIFVWDADNIWRGRKRRNYQEIALEHKINLSYFFLQLKKKLNSDETLEL